MFFESYKIVAIGKKKRHPSKVVYTFSSHPLIFRKSFKKSVHYFWDNMKDAEKTLLISH